MALSRRFWRSAYISIAIIISAAGLAHATTVIMPSDTQLMIESRAIVRAKVKSVSTGLDEQSGIVYTYIKLKVTDVFKGDIRDSTIVLKQPGGATADRGTMIFSAPQFAAGERVIVYLQTMDDGTLRVHDAFLGKYSIVKDAARGNEMVVRGAPHDAVNIVPQASAVDSTDKMELGAYLRKLREGLSANMQKSLDFADQFYARTPMLSQPPEYQDKAKSGGLQPEFHLLGPGRWFQPDSGQPVTIMVNAVGAPSGFQADVDAAMGAWSNIAGCALRVVDGGTTTACPGASGVSVAEFSNCMGFFSSSGGSCQGILAEGGFNYGGGTRVVNGTTFYQIGSGFISFNPFAACYYGDACNVQEVTTHEMGHSLGMGHSWDPSYGGSPSATDQAATMYYIAHFDGRCASIRTDDINGITFIYPGSSTPPPPSYVGFIDHAACDTIGGWAADQNRLNTSINVEIYDGATLISTVTASNSRTDVGSFLGDNGLHGFSIPTPASLKNGAAHSVHVKFEATATELSGSPTSLTCGGGSTPNYVGYVDHAACDSISGWAADRNRLNTSINIEIYDGTTLITTVLASNSRTDVGAFLGDNGLHGFSVTTPAALKDGAAHSVHVKFETSSTELAGSPMSLTCGGTSTPNYAGYVDHAACDSISGWAADKNRLNTSINIEIYDGTTLIATVLAGNSRTDVGAFLGDNGLHGFSVATPAALTDGSVHSVHVRFEASATDLTNSPVSISCGTTSSSLQGSLDTVNCTSIAGWAWDASQPSTSINVDIRNGGVLIATVPANIFRQDLMTAGIGNGKHAFSVATPAGLITGTTYTILVDYGGTSTQLPLSPKSLTCP